MKIKKRQLWIVPLLGLTLWNPAALAGDSLTGNSAREQRQESLQQLEPENWKSGIPEYSLKKALERASWWGDETDSRMSINEKVEKLPDQFWDLIELQGLDLSDCWLTELSSGIGQLTQLKYLDLSGNLLTELPPRSED